MKALTSLAAALLLALAAAPATAQDRTPLARADVAATAGLLTINKTEFDSYNRRHGEAFFTLGAGWYWTDHLKTDVEIGASTETRTYRAVPIDIGGQQQIAATSVRFHSNRVALVQHYQFRRNEWFHPSVGGGIDVVRERYSLTDEPIYFYDQATRQSRVLRDAVAHGDEDEVTVRALATSGFKAYVSPRSFFLGDLRVTFTSRAEDILLRFGFGVDF
jgi:hypothetical protein